MRTCKEISRLISQSQDRQLGYADRFAMRVHLVICKGCTNFRGQLEFLREALRRFPGPGEDGKG
jgi:hypothetical protein